MVIKPPPSKPNFEDIFAGDSRNNTNVIWRIEPVNGGIPFHDAPIITYGEIPKGWQTHPQSGAPPALIEGQSYYAGQPFTAQDAVLIFKVKSGKATLNQ